MEKNVIVVDEQGNEYGATYPKRARGLVKNGRARFVEENKICLACPPNNNLEDQNMEENKNIAVAEAMQNDQLTVAYILGQIEKIFADNKHIHEALTKLEGVKSGEMGDIGAQAKAQGIADVVKCRETTNQQLLNFYTKVYDDLMAQKMDRRAEKIELIKSIQLSIIEQMRMVLDEGDLLECARRVEARLDSLCTDVLCDKI